ncbi:MAG: MlaD family protein [Gemmatimonadetes bacterium]|nr:MlaD family protein [Gemmatimonadota bacterium]
MAKASPKLVGMFVLAAVAMLVTGIVVFSSGNWFATTHDFILFFDGNVSGLNPGAPVKFRGVEIGAVREVRIDIAGVSGRESEAGIGPGIPVIFYIDEQRLHKRGAATNRISDPDSVQMLIGLGLRAELKVESFVTGRRYIELDFLPDSPDNRVNDSLVPYTELPTVVTGLNLGAIQDDLTHVLREIGDLELASTLKSIKETFDSLQMVISTPEIRQAMRKLPDVVQQMEITLARYADLATELDTTVVPFRASIIKTSDQAEVTLKAAEESFVAVRNLLDPESPMAVQLAILLREVAASARATAQLTEYLQRNPSSLVRGKPEEKD